MRKESSTPTEELDNGEVAESVELPQAAELVETVLTPEEWRKQIIPQFQELLRNYSTVKESFYNFRDPVVADVPTTNQSAAEVMSARAKLYEEGLLLAQTIEQLAVSVLDKCNDANGLKELATAGSILIAIDEKLHRIEEINVELTVLERQHVTCAWREAGVTNQNDITVKIENCNEEINLHRQRIREIDHHLWRRIANNLGLKHDRKYEHDTIYSLYDQIEQWQRLSALGEYFVTKIVRVEHDTKNKLLEAVKRVSELVLQQLTRSLESSVGSEPVAAADRAEPAEADPIDHSQLGAVNNIYVDNYINKLAGDDLRQVPAALQEQIKALISAIILRSVDIEQEEVAALIETVKTQYPQLFGLSQLLHNVRYHIFDLPGQFQTCQSLVARHPIIQAEQQQADTYQPLITSVQEALTESNLRYEIGSNLDQLNTLMRRFTNSAAPRQFQEDFDALNLDYWAAYCQVLQRTDAPEGAQALALDQWQAEKLRQQLISQPEHTNESMRWGSRLMYFHEPAVIPVVFMNAFRESGPSGNFMHIDSNSRGRETALYQYINSLTDEELAAAEQTGVPQVAEIARCIKDNPDTFSLNHLYNPKTKEYEPYPARANIEQQLVELARHYLEAGDASMELFVVELLVRLTEADISSCSPFLIDLLERNNPRLSATIVELAVNRLRWHNTDNEIFDVILAAWPTLSPAVKDGIRANGGELFGGFIRQPEDAVRLQAMAELLDRPLAAVQKTIDLVRHLSDNPALYHSFDAKYLAAYFDLAQREGVFDLILRLNQYGFYFQVNDTPTLLAIYDDRDRILAQLAEITEVLPEYTYRPYSEYHYQSGKQLDETVYEPFAVMANNRPAQLFARFYPRLLADAGTNELPNQFIDAVVLRLQPRTVTWSLADIETRRADLKQLIIAVEDPSGELAAYRDFYYSTRCLDFVLANPDQLDDLLALGYEGFLADERLITFFSQNLDALVGIPKERRKEYLVVLAKVVTSPSQEVQRIRDQLLQQLLQTADPEGEYNKIEQVFIHNNLPTVGKVFQVFNILYPPQAMATKLHAGSSSPYLVRASKRRRRATVYNDLIKAHIQSGNRSLRNYLQLLQQNEILLARLDEVGPNQLSAADQRQMQRFATMLRTLYANSQLGAQQREAEPVINQDVTATVRDLARDLGVSPGQSITDRLAEMFLRPSGYTTFTEALAAMQAAKREAHQRGLLVAQQAAAGTLTVAAGDLLKGIDPTYIVNILQNGSVAKEYLGAGSNSDATPFDTDVSMITAEDAADGFDQAVQNSIAFGYGDLIFAVKQREQFVVSDRTTNEAIDPRRLELFPVGEVGSRHYGIRTGFPTTEIDFMIAKPELANSLHSMEKLYCEIAQNGFYIPVVDLGGSLIFTPEMYDRYRRVFNGIAEFEGDPLAFRPTLATDRSYQAVSAIMSQTEHDDQHIEQLPSAITVIVESVLREEGISIKDPLDRGLLGAELLNIGSTARHTNMVGDNDFDFSLKLDDADFGQVPSLVEKIIARLSPQADNSHGDELQHGYYQLRASGCQSVGGADIDIGIVRKSELSVYGSHDAVTNRLNSIREQHGDEAYKMVIANIKLTKQLLKDGLAYKRVKHGGFGGIGVENWLLAHGGNLVEAFQSFWEAAHEGDRQLSLDEFSQRYSLIDPGINIKWNRHDNFIMNLKPEGYAAMLNVIAPYCQ